MNSEMFTFSWSSLGRTFRFVFYRSEQFCYLETRLHAKSETMLRYFMGEGCFLVLGDECVPFYVDCFSDEIKKTLKLAIDWAFGGNWDLKKTFTLKTFTLSDFIEQESIRPIIEMQIALADEKERARKLDFVVSTLENDLDNTKSQNIKMMSQIDSLQQQLKTQREDLQARHFEQMTQILRQNNMYLTPDMKIKAEP